MVISFMLLLRAEAIINNIFFAEKKKVVISFINVENHLPLCMEFLLGHQGAKPGPL
jgi:hypothetical protein